MEERDENAPPEWHLKILGERLAKRSADRPHDRDWDDAMRNIKETLARERGQSSD